MPVRKNKKTWNYITASGYAFGYARQVSFPLRWTSPTSGFAYSYARQDAGHVVFELRPTRHLFFFARR